MRFLDWLLGDEQKPGPTPFLDDFRKIFEKPKPKKPEPDPRKFKQVPKWTHPGKKGKTVYCPRCMHGTHVGHFAWTALSCSRCKASAGKYDWLLRVENN